MLNLKARRELSRALSGIAAASVAEALARLSAPARGAAARIGVTGAPGAGKSTLISRLARLRADRGRTVGVLAVDPSSPLSGGAVLGDRIRMEAVAEHPGIFIRSLASKGAHEGLAHNLPDLLHAMDAFGFDDVIVETVGVGQSEIAVHDLVDTTVLVLTPASGDEIQVMKAGVMELADVYVVNKADLPGAARFAAEVGSVARMRRGPNGDYRPAVVQAKLEDEAAIRELDAAIDLHFAWLAASADAGSRKRAQARLHVRALLTRRVDEVVRALPAQALDLAPAELYELALATIAPARGVEGIYNRLGGNP
jgi:LAO/AO transport system kinase